jgi:hypothetical protein
MNIGFDRIQSVFRQYVAAIHWARQVGLSCTGITESITVQRAQRPAEPLGRQLCVTLRHWNNELTGFADIL